MSDLLKPAREAAHADLAYYRKMTMRNPSNTAAPIDTSAQRVDAGDLPPLPEPYGHVTTHKVTGQQFFYRYPHPPYLDTAKELVTVVKLSDAIAYAAAAVAAERERCARIVERHCGAWDDDGYALAAAIRGEQK